MSAEIRLSDFLDAVYVPLKLSGKSDHSIRLHKVTLSNFKRFLLRDPVTTDFTDETILRFMNWMKDRGRAAITANDNRNRLLALWRLAARKGIVPHYPDVPPLTEPTRIPMAWTEQQLTTLFSECRRTPGTVDGVDAGAWWIALHELSWDTAERIGAMLQIEWDWIDLESGWLVIPAEARKGQTEDKVSRLHPDTVASLRAIREPRRKMVFPWPWHVGTLYNRYGKLLAKAGLPSDRRSKFHRMRKSAASHFEANGGNATVLLGHSSRRVTKRYLDPRIVGEQQASDVLFRVRTEGFERKPD